jgi:Arc-like DNA binding domain
MSQVTWRAPDELVERVRRVAARQGRSLNDYLTRLAEAAVDPELAGDDAAGSKRRRPDPDAVAGASRRAGEGTPLSDLIEQERG